MTNRSLKNIDLSLLNTEEAIEVFKTLECPSMAEMNGEFRGKMLTFPTLAKTLFGAVISKNPVFPGIWQGKSFRARDEQSGVGYNTCNRLKLLGGRIDLWPMLTDIGPSFFDGRPSFRLIYRAFDHYAGEIHMLDEVRRLDDGRYLGIGRTGRSTKERRIPMPFLLVGPVGNYREDVGAARAGFDLNEELELLEFPKSVARKARKQS